MAMAAHLFPQPRQTARPTTGAVAGGHEMPFWSNAGAQWRQIAGNLEHTGFSFEWHEWRAPVTLNWAPSFHPDSLEICLNLEGRGWVGTGHARLEFTPQTVGFFAALGDGLCGERAAGDHHKFLSVEFSASFLRRRLAEHKDQLHPLLEGCLQQKRPGAAVSRTSPITQRHRDLLNSLLSPPVLRAAQRLFYESKALEFAAEFFYADSSTELLCSRAQRVAQARVNRAKEVLRERLLAPPSLEELGRLVGCSHFYLSRTFTRETGMTISQWIRNTRLECAAELLRAGKCNVTEAALEVGYSSLSHFSQAFHERFGCCPGLYPLKTPAQEECHPTLAARINRSESELG